MPEFIIRRLTKPTESELDLLERICEIAAKDQPINRLACGNNPALLPEYFRSLIRGAAACGHLLVVCHDYPHNIVGCVACYGPGKDIMSDDEQRSLGFNAFLDKLTPEAMSWWSRFVPQYVTVSDSILGPGMKSASWSFHCLSVDPNFRGRGAGRALVEACEALAKQDGLPMIFQTESDRNTSLYQFWGYNLVGQRDLDAGLGRKITLRIFRKDFTKA